MKILLCLDAGQCYDGKAGVSLLEEARTIDNGANNADDGFSLGLCRLQKDPLQRASHAGIFCGSNVLSRRSNLIRYGHLSLAWKSLLYPHTGS